MAGIETTLTDKSPQTKTSPFLSTDEKGRTLTAKDLHRESAIYLTSLSINKIPFSQVFIYPVSFELTTRLIGEMSSMYQEAIVRHGKKFKNQTPEELEKMFLKELGFTSSMTYHHVLNRVPIISHSFPPGARGYITDAINSLWGKHGEH